MQHRHDGIEIRRTQHQRGQVLWRTGQTHGGLDNKAQCALGTNEQLTQVVTGGVLDQVLVQLQQLAATGNHLEAGHPVAGHAVANDLDATGVGADIAADLAGAGRGKINRIVEIMLFGKVLQLLGDHARLTDHGTIILVEIKNAVHVIERHHHLAIGGYSGSGQAGTSA